MKTLIGIVVAGWCVIVFAATPQVKNVRAMQQYPWGHVCLTYEVEGNIAANAGSGKTPFLVIVAKDKTTGKILCESADSCLSGDTGVAPGAHKVLWDFETQGVSFNPAAATFTVMYCDEVYLVVDLSAGVKATSYPISYLGSVPSSGWTDAYKTTKLVLRRLPAGTFKMQNTSNVTLSKPFYMGVFEFVKNETANPNEIRWLYRRVADSFDVREFA